MFLHSLDDEEKLEKQTIRMPKKLECQKLECQKIRMPKIRMPKN